MAKHFIQKIVRLGDDVGFNFYMAHAFSKYILRQNKSVKWAIHYTSTIHHPENIIKGKNVFPGDSPGNYIEASNGITIGDYTNIGPNVGIISANHDPVNNLLHIEAPPIIIGKFCWIAMNAIILPSVHLGDFTKVGAGSVGTKNFKRAVDRNRIKRLMREAYRLQKNPLQKSVEEKQTKLVLFIIYIGNEVPLFDDVRTKMESLLQRLQKKL